MVNKVFWQDDEYIVRPALNLDESRDTFWAFMQKLGWVCNSPRIYVGRRLRSDCKDRIDVTTTLRRTSSPLVGVV